MNFKEAAGLLRYTKQYFYCKKLWKNYFLDLLERNPSKNEKIDNFLKTRKMSSLKVFLPIVISDILSKNINKPKTENIVLNSMSCYLSCRALEDILDNNLVPEDPKKILKDILHYSFTSKELFSLPYDKDGLTNSIIFILRQANKLIPGNEKQRYFVMASQLLETEKLEFSSSEEERVKGRLEVCGRYTQLLYEIASIHLGVKNEEVANAIYKLGLASRFYDDAIDPDQQEKSKNKLIKLGREYLDLAKNCITTKREKQIFNRLVSALELRWLFKSTLIKN